jgi:trimeric autotransporter adhesin
MEDAIMALNPGDLYFANIFNDATRILEGGLWHNAVEESNQGVGTDVRYTNDLTTVLNGLQADVTAGDFTGDQLTHINTVINDITTALNNVQGAVQNNADAEAALRTAHLDVINTIQNDPVLQALSVQDGNSGFNSPPPASGQAAADLPVNTFAEIGVLFDDAQSMSLGGINANNVGAITADLQDARTGLQNLMQNHPELFGGATGIHAQKILNCLDLELNKYIPEYGINPDAARGTNDVFLDLTDVVTADTNLTNMAHINGVNGWTPAPATDVPSTPYQDNADQTNFLADFIASSNTLGTQAQQLVQNGTPDQVAALINTLNTFETNTKNFVESQGGIYEARFDNELEGNFGTAGAAIKGIVDGLNTHNAALVTAGAEVLHNNAADVAGNNIPLNGGAYNVDGQTLADALSTATPPLPQPPLTTLLASIQSQTANQANANAAGAGAADANVNAAPQANPAADASNHLLPQSGASAQSPQLAQHDPLQHLFGSHTEHMWG